MLTCTHSIDSTHSFRYTNSEYANALVTGMQGDDPKWLQISACAKHFAVHSWNTPSNYMAYPTAQDLADTYFPAFQAAAEAGVSGFMCSYNGVNGLPMCAQHDLLVKVRNEWNFSGYVTSDCGAVGGPWYKSNNWTSAADQVQQSFAAGMDTDCGGGAFSSTEMLAVLDTHPAIRAQADVALTHLLTVQFRLGMFEKPHDAPGGSGGGGSSQPAWSKYGQEQINTAQNRNLVLEAAQQGLVLLKNAKPTDGGGGGRGGASGLGLPLDSTAIKSLALVGPNVHNIVTHDCKKPLRQEPSYLGCEGCYCANAIDPVNPQQGFAMHTSRINFTAGCSDIHCEADSAQWSMAAAAAAQADATVAIMGLDVTQECEGLDRRDVSMPGGQNEFTSLVCAAAAVGGKPCIVLIMSGSAVDSSAIESNPNVTAVVWVGYPGERGGEAIANAVFGMHDSFGRLPFSIYRSAYYEPYCPNAPGTAACNGLSPLDFSMRPNASTHNPGRTYRFYKGANMLHPFGYGLSYNAWHLGEAATSVAGGRGLHGVLQLARLESAATGGDAQTSEEAATVSVQAWHSGRFAQSSTVVMCYATPPPGISGEDGNPIKSLVGFQRLIGDSTATVSEVGTGNGGGGMPVTFSLPRKAFLLANEVGEWRGKRGVWTITVEVGSEEAFERATTTFRVV